MSTAKFLRVSTTLALQTTLNHLEKIMKFITAVATIALLTIGLFAEAAKEKEGLVKIQDLSQFAQIVPVNEGNTDVSEVNKGTRDVIVTFKGCMAKSAKDFMIVQSGTETAVNYSLIEKNNAMKSHVSCVTTVTSKVRLKFLVSPSKLGALNL